MADDSKTLGEIGRTVDRIEKALDELRKDVAPIGTLSLRISNAEDDLIAVRADLNAVSQKVWWVTGAGSALAFVAGIVAKWLKS